jgi:hypothetical protein
MTRVVIGARRHTFSCCFLDLTTTTGLYKWTTDHRIEKSSVASALGKNYHHFAE